MFKRRLVFYQKKQLEVISRGDVKARMRKKIFNDIDLGAKTGTINDPLDLFKYDWITIYAVPKNHSKRIAIAVLTVHGKKLGKRAKDLAREILNYRFTS